MDKGASVIPLSGLVGEKKLSNQMENYDCKLGIFFPISGGCYRRLILKTHLRKVNGLP